MNNIASQVLKLYSGEEYTLNDLFNGNNRIIIPDLQRDYCWGDKAWIEHKGVYSELVTGFLQNLIDVYKEKPNEKLTMGLIYGYENPHSNIQLCDGQQRITTLFLILGMIYRKIEYALIKSLLITDDELNDDKEPNLQYAIRESTLYFISDLVCNYFLNPDVETDQINKSDWYFKEYDLDASIQSMISAISIIEPMLNKLESKEDIKQFGDFIISKLQFIYYDMGTRTRGEETFVIINTTGEPLSATENLKPILIGNHADENKKKKFSDEWEDREEWFWLNKSKDESTSDEGLNDFFIWYWQINLLQEQTWKNKKAYPLNPKELFIKKPKFSDDDEETPEIKNWEKSINLETVQKYFNALQRVLEKSKLDQTEKVLRSIKNEEIDLNWFRKADLDIILPLIAYLEKFNNGELYYQFVRRIRKNYYDKTWEERNSNYVDWRHIIQIIEFSEKEEDVLKFETISSASKFKNIANVKLNEWFNDEEKEKDVLRESFAKEIEEWENHPDFMGDLSFLLSMGKDIGELIKLFNNYRSTIDLVRNEDITNDHEVKIVNLFRLFYLFIGCNKVGHMERVTWKADGVLFSTINRSHLEDDEFKELIKSSDILHYLKAFIKKQIDRDFFNLTEINFTTDRAIKVFLTLKVFKANSENKVLAFYDGNGTGVAVYKVAQDNKLLEDKPFSIYNMLCGFGVKAGGAGSYIRYAKDENWLKSNIINTPFAGIKQAIEERYESQIVENREEIDKIIFSIFE